MKSLDKIFQQAYDSFDGDVDPDAFITKAREIYDAPEAEKRAGASGALASGAESTWGAIKAFGNTLAGDNESVVDNAASVQSVEKTEQQQRFMQALRQETEGGDESLLDGLGNVWESVKKEPKGALHEMIAQLPNSGIALGGMWAGAKMGAKLPLPPQGKAIAAIVGGIAGLFVGNTAIETGHKAVDKASDGTFTDDDRTEALSEGITKGAVITGVDAATLKLGSLIAGAPGRAMESAVTKTLIDNGVDVSSEAAIKHALKSADLYKSVTEAGALALEKATGGLTGVGRASTEFGLQTAGEGVGEYAGEVAATGEASITEAVLESALSAPQSAVEMGVSRTLIGKGKNSRLIKDAPAPESQGSLQAQMEAMESGRKRAVLVTPGSPFPESIPAGMSTTEIEGHGTLIHRENDTEAVEKAGNGQLGEILSYGTNEQPDSDTVVTARDEQGEVIQDVSTDGRPEITEAAEQVAGAEGSIEQRPADEAALERQTHVREERVVSRRDATKILTREFTDGAITHKQFKTRLRALYGAEASVDTKEELPGGSVQSPIKKPTKQPPDPLLVFPDGSTGTKSQIDDHLNYLEQQGLTADADAFRAKVYRRQSFDEPGKPTKTAKLPPGAKPGDLLTSKGASYKTKPAAVAAIKRHGVKEYEPIKIKGGWVARAIKQPVQPENKNGIISPEKLKKGADNAQKTETKTVLKPSLPVKPERSKSVEKLVTPSTDKITKVTDNKEKKEKLGGKKAVKKTVKKQDQSPDAIVSDVLKEQGSREKAISYLRGRYGKKKLPDLVGRLDKVIEQESIQTGQDSDKKLNKQEKSAQVDEKINTKETAEQIDAAANEAATSPKNNLPEPTDPQKDAGNYKVGKISLHGINISIENPAGSKRRPEWPTLKSNYGYFNRTEGKDGDHVDVFLTEDAGNPELSIFVVDQISPKTGRLDEHKAMMGFKDEKAAIEGYAENYTKDWHGLGQITEVSIDDFKVWLDKGDTKKKFSGKGYIRIGERRRIAQKFGSGADKTAQPGDQKATKTSKTPKDKITDLGEKIGGARKDTSVKTGPKGELSTKNIPAWKKRYLVVENMLDATKESRPWMIVDSRTGKVIRGSNYSDMYFNTEEDAIKILPLIAVSQKHSVYSDGSKGFSIWRKVSDRKLIRVTPEIFKNREDGMEFLAKNAEEILETKLSFGEEVLPTPEKVYREGESRRDSDVSGNDFMEIFGFRAVEFGNWNNQQERQEVMNHAYDALLDMAEIISVPPKALSLNGDLALAFGARGQGLSGAKAHYEREHAVINLTKMKGAGSLAHEWLHSLDHYFGRLDGKASNEMIENSKGDKIFKSKGIKDYGSHGFQYPHKTKARVELRDAYKNLIQSMFKKAEIYVEDTQKAEEFVSGARDNLKDNLDKIINGLAEQLDPKYYKRKNKPASEAQLQRFDQLIDVLINGEQLDLEMRENKNSRSKYGSYRQSNDVVDEMAEIYKMVRGLSGFKANKEGEFDGLRRSIVAYRDRIQVLKEANQGKGKTKKVPTNYYMQAKSADQARTGEYWSSPHEMAARAFAAYVEDKLTGKQAKNDFLAYHAHGTVLVPLYPEGFYRPYPEGKERVAVNKAFDKLFNVIESKETDKGIALFKRTTQSSTGLSVSEIRKAIIPGWKKLKNKVPVEIVENYEDLPPAVYQKIQKEKVDIEGVAYKGKIYLVASQISSAERAQTVLFDHELRHIGLRKLLGNKLNPLLNSAWMGVEHDKIKAFGEKLGIDMSTQNGKKETAEEYIVNLAETGQTNNLLDKLYAIIRDFMRSIGFNVKLSDIDLREIVANAGRVMKTGKAASPDGAIAMSIRQGGDSRATVAGEPALFSKEKPVFYSQMKQVLTEKLPGSGGSMQFKQTIQAMAKKGKFKQEELEWSGVLDWLEGIKGKVTKDQVVEYLDKSEIQVKETVNEAEEYPIKEKAREDFDENFDEDPWFYEATTEEALKAWSDPKHMAWLSLENSKDDYIEDQKYEGVVDEEESLEAFKEDFMDLGASNVYQDYDSLIEEAWDQFKDDYISGQQMNAEDYNNNLSDGGSPTKYSEYQTPEGENYRELLLTLPNKHIFTLSESEEFNRLLNIPDGEWDGSGYSSQRERTKAEENRFKDLSVRLEASNNNYKSTHFDESNILAHVRFNERIDSEGKQVLFIEEVQSDWHQNGREKGYKKERSIRSMLSKKYDLPKDTLDWNMIILTEAGATNREAESWAKEVDINAASVPNAPFKTTWPLLAMKRMIRYAADNGFDKIAWTTGEMQSDRYDLSKQVDTIQWTLLEGDKYQIQVIKDNNLLPVFNGDKIKIVDKKELTDIIGKDAAKKIIESKSQDGDLTGDDLKVGGEGMKAFYDKMLPSMINKYVKKWSAKVSETEINEYSNNHPETGEEISASDTVHSLDITDKMSAAVVQGQPLFSRLSPTTGRRGTNFTVPEETLKDRVARKFQDKFQRLYKTQESISNQVGKVHIDSDPHAAEERMHGKIENDFKTLENDYIEPMADALARNDIPREDLDTYLIARHAEERNKYIASIREDMQDGGSGMLTADAKAHIQRLEAKHPKIEQAAKTVWDALAYKRSLLKKNDLLSDELFDAWQKGYKHYVPLKGWAEDAIDENHPRIGSGLSIKGKESKEALGRKSRADSPSMQAISDIAESIVRARKNEVGLHLLNLVEATPNKAFWEIFSEGKPDTEKRKVNGKVVESPVAMHMSTNYFGVKREGKQYYIKLNDKRMQDAMQNLGIEKQSAVIRTLGSINRFLSSVNTSLNPEFVISNFSRDIQTAVYNSLAESDLHDSKIGNEKIALKMIKDVPASMKAIYGALRKKQGNKQIDQYAKDFIVDGAKTGFFDMKDIEAQKRHVETLVQISKGTFKGKAFKALKSVGQLVEDINGAVENAVRLSAYMNARKAMEASGVKSSVARKKAASLAKNLTVNFNRRGEVSTVANSLYMFFNAGTQGIAQFARTMLTLKNVDGKKKLNVAQKAAIGMFGFAYVLASVNRASSDDDEDGESFYDKIDAHIKERNMIIMKANGRDYWKIPLPYGYNFFHVLGTTFNDTTQGPKKVTEGAMDVANALLGSFNPVGMSGSDNPGTTFIKTVAPTVLTPAVELISNENFFGSPVYREDKYNERTPDSSLYFTGTKEHYKITAQWLNEVTGGSLWEKGAIDISPDALEHWVEFAFGGAGRFVDKSIGGAEKISQGISLKDREVPFLRKISGQPSEYEPQHVYYERRAIALSKIDAIKHMPAADKKEYLSRNAKFIRMGKMNKGLDKQLRKIRKTRNLVRAGNFGTKAKDLRLKAIESEMSVLYKRYNKQWNQLIENQGTGSESHP